MSTFFITYSDLAGLLRAHRARARVRSAEKRLARARRRGQKTVQVDLDEYARLVKLDANNAGSIAWVAVRALRDTLPEVGRWRENQIEHAIDDGADLLSTLNELDVQPWEDHGRELSEYDIGLADAYLRGVDDCEAQVDEEPYSVHSLHGAMWRSGWHDRAAKLRKYRDDVLPPPSERER